MTGYDLCQYLSWDSDFFDCRIARAKVNILTDKTFRSIKQWCAAEKIDCLYFPADSSDAATNRIAEKNNFRFVDVRVTLDKNNFSPTGGDSSIIRLAKIDDIAALREIAAANHRDSRFYNDDRFPQTKCDELYALWIEKSCQGFADAVLVPEIDGRAVGYITCSVKKGKGEIGLVGLKDSERGKGLGGRLIAAADGWFTEQNVDQISVVTQGRNVKAQRLYQKNNFFTRRSELWYHFWLK